MDTKDIRGFIRSFEVRSINKAAADLFISPQGLGKAIGRLEAELGAKLFTRTPNGLLPTESGIFFYQKATELMNRFRDIEQGVKNCAAGINSFRIGYSCGVSNVLDVTKMEQFALDHPGDGISWHEADNESVKERTLTGNYNAAFVIGLVPSDDIFQKIIVKRNYNAVVYEGHPLYDRDSISMQDLRGEKLITLNENYQSFYNITERCRDFGFVPDIRIKTMESPLIYKYAAERLGVGIDVDIHNASVFNYRVKAVKISDSIPWTVCFACPAENIASPVVRGLLQSFCNE